MMRRFSLGRLSALLRKEVVQMRRDRVDRIGIGDDRYLAGT